MGGCLQLRAVELGRGGGRRAVRGGEAGEAPGDGAEPREELDADGAGEEPRRGGEEDGEAAAAAEVEELPLARRVGVRAVLGDDGGDAGEASLAICEGLPREAEGHGVGDALGDAPVELAVPVGEVSSDFQRAADLGITFKVIGFAARKLCI